MNKNDEIKIIFLMDGSIEYILPDDTRENFRLVKHRDIRPEWIANHDHLKLLISTIMI